MHVNYGDFQNFYGDFRNPVPKLGKKSYFEKKTI